MISEEERVEGMYVDEKQGVVLVMAVGYDEKGRVINWVAHGTDDAADWQKEIVMVEGKRMMDGSEGSFRKTSVRWDGKREWKKICISRYQMHILRKPPPPTYFSLYIMCVFSRFVVNAVAWTATSTVKVSKQLATGLKAKRQ